MNSIIKILSILIFIVFSNNIYSQCGINSPVASNVTCIEEATYQFDLNFTISGTDLDSFNIFINDILINRYHVDELPINIVNDTKSGLEQDVITIVDSNNQDCNESISIDNPCLCVQFNFNYSKTNCTDSTFNIILDFDNIYTSDSFDIGIVNSPFGGHAYADLPITIGPFEVADTTYLVFIADRIDFFCFAEFPVNGMACPNCNISNIEILDYTCDENYKKNITFSFDHSNSSSDQFLVDINGVFYDSYLYQNSFIVDSVSVKDTFTLNSLEIDCDSIFEIKIYDDENLICFGIEEFISPCCELCEIGEIFVTDQVCTSDSTIEFILDFEYNKNRNDSFSIYNYDILFGTYSISELPLNIVNYEVGIEQFDSITICMDSDRCCNENVFEIPDCEYFGCVINDVTYTELFDTMGRFWLKIDFQFENTSDKFSISGNGKNYGSFDYSNLPIILGAFNCDDSLDLEFEIKDFKAESCTYILKPGEIICPTSGVSDELEQNHWKIFSTLGRNELNVISSDDYFDKASLEIYNILGDKLLTFNLPNGLNKKSISLDILQTGIYIVQFKNGNYWTSKKILIQN